MSVMCPLEARSSSWPKDIRLTSLCPVTFQRTSEEARMVYQEVSRQCQLLFVDTGANLNHHRLRACATGSRSAFMPSKGTSGAYLVFILGCDIAFSIVSVCCVLAAMSVIASMLASVCIGQKICRSKRQTICLSYAALLGQETSLLLCYSDTMGSIDDSWLCAGPCFMITDNNGRIFSNGDTNSQVSNISFHVTQANPSLP